MNKTTVWIDSDMNEWAEIYQDGSIPLYPWRLKITHKTKGSVGPITYKTKKELLKELNGYIGYCKNIEYIKNGTDKNITGIYTGA